MSTETLPPPPASATPPRRRWPRALLVSLVVVAVVAGAVLTTMVVAALSGRSGDTTREVVAEPVDVVEVDVSSGDVEVTAGSDDHVEVTATRRWSLWGEPTVTTEVEGGRLRVAGDCRGWFVTWCSTSVRVEVPADVVVVADSEAGSVEVRGTDADVEARSAAGNITVADVAGDVTLRTAAGSIDASGLTGDRVEARTSAGNVTILAERAPQQVEAVSDAGSVDVVLPDGPYDVDADTSVGAVDVDVVSDPSAERSVFAHTSAGNVMVRGH